MRGCDRSLQIQLRVAVLAPARLAQVAAMSHVSTAGRTNEISMRPIQSMAVGVMAAGRDRRASFVLDIS